MRKLTKLSLVAAVAVSSVTSFSSAKPLEDAIKNTDISGYIRYRYTNGEGNLESNEYKIVITTKSKVNDKVTAKIKIAGAGKTTNSTGDADPDPTAVREANFIITPVKGTTIVAGKQGLATPFADPVDQQGTGVVVLQNAGPVTIAAGWFTNSDATSDSRANGVASVDIGGNNIAAVAAIGKAGPVNFEAWYAKIDEKDLSINNGATYTGITAGASAVDLNVKGKFGPASVEFNYASVAYTSNNATINDANPTQTRLVVSVSPMKALTASFGVVKAGEDGGDVTLGDSDAKANFLLEDFDARDLKDATATYVGLKYKAGKACAGVEYGRTSEITPGGDSASELKIKAAYSMSKNFKVSGFITKDSGALDGKDKNRIEIKYTF